MKKSLKVLGIVFSFALCLYVGYMYLQVNEVSRICDEYKTKVNVENNSYIKPVFSVMHGPKDINDLETIIYCASLTMCEYSCMVQTESGVVKNVYPNPL